MNKLDGTQGCEGENGKRHDEDAIAQNPPATKKGGRKASNENKSLDRIGFWAGIDYLTVSYPRNWEPRELSKTIQKQFVSSGEPVLGEHGYRGTDICGGYGKVLIRQCRDSADGDVLVRLPGRALDWIRDANVLSDSDFQCTDADICRYFADRGFLCTRIDIAMDTNDPAIKPEVVEALINANSYVCRARKAGLSDSWNTEQPKTRGTAETVYLGGRTSTRYFRCYNKAADIFNRSKRHVGHLTRFEIETKGEAGQRTMQLVADKGNHCIANLFAGWINFKDPNDSATRIQRRRNVDWWERLVGGQEPISLGLQRGVSTPERSMVWLKQQVAKTLFLAHRHGLFEEVIEAVNSKKFKVKAAENEKWKYFGELKRQANLNSSGGAHADSNE